MTSALLTDLYELTMLEAARDAGTASRRCVFEVFTRSLPAGRRYGVLAGTGRVLDAIADFRFDDADLRYLASTGALREDTLDHLAQYEFTGDVFGYQEGELFFPNSPVLRIEGTFENAVMLETVVLSILNHDSGVASVGSRMVTAARGRPLIEMGGRRVHEDAAIAAARSAYLVGFASTSNLAAGAHYRIPVAGTSAHAFTLLFDSEEDAFRAQLATQGAGTTVLVDTYDVESAVRTAVETPALARRGAPDPGTSPHRPRTRAPLDSPKTDCITATGDPDEHRVEELKDPRWTAIYRHAPGHRRGTRARPYKLVSARVPTGRCTRSESVPRTRRRRRRQGRLPHGRRPARAELGRRARRRSPSSSGSDRGADLAPEPGLGPHRRACRRSR